MSDRSGVVVVGGSIAGVRTVQALRKEGYEGRIRLLTEELLEPYDKPPLSKQYLAGTKSLNEFTLLTRAGASELGVELLLGARAVSLDPDWASVTLADGSQIGYEHLVVATGSRPRATPWDTVDGVWTLRNLGDSDQLRLAIESATRIAVVGAGFIGAEVAATARARGVEVTMIDPLPFPMARVLGGALAERFIELHRNRGVELLMNTRVDSIRNTGRGIELVLSGADVLVCDAVVVGIGTLPNTAWLSASSLHLENGVACDACGRATDAPGIYAVGDVAQWLDPHDGIPRRHEHWTNAVEQAAVVAKVIVHGDAPDHRPTPYVWSDQFDWHLQVVGDPARGELVDTIDNSSTTDDSTGTRSRFAAVYGAADGTISGGVIVSWPKATFTLRRALQDKAHATGAAQSLRELTRP